jgi:hypothetical protein
MTSRRLITTLVTAGALLTVSACTDDGPGAVPATTDPIDSSNSTPTPTPPTEPAEPTTTPTTRGDTARPQGIRSALGFFGDCPALLDYLQVESSERVTAWGLGNGPMMYAEEALEDSAGADVDRAGAPTAVPAAPDTTDGFSGTNTQESGVDEGDIVETDGEYVYDASTDGLRIVEVDGATVVAEPELPQGQHQLLLDGDRLLVATSSWSGTADTIVSVYDVTDPSNPSLLRRSHLEGQLVTTRAVDGVARLVITTALDQRLTFVTPDQFGLDEESALARNRQIIEESGVDDWLPRWFDESANGAFDAMQPILDCSDVAAPDEFAGLGVTWIASVDLAGDSTPVGSAGIVSTGQNVYASTDNLYITTQNYDWWWGGPIPVDATRAQEPVEPSGPPPTSIHQFRLGPDSAATYVASGAVEGRLLNQYAMSEYNGDLRVATTVDDWGEQGISESVVTVLRPNGDLLEPLSQIGGLGKGEQIYAVRFIDDVGYVVTFRQVDPLYVLDLSDPANPVLDGELKIPGYSAYLHPVGDGLLLGVGQDATTEGRTTGTQMSLFDVSDPANPRQVSTLPIGGYSEVEWDPHAFLYWQPDGTIVIPASPGWTDCGPQIDCLANGITGGAGGAVVAEIVDGQLQARGVINHESTDRSGCWNPLQRSIAVGDELVTIGLDQLKISDRQSLAERASVSWGDPEQFGCYWYVEG